MLRRGTSRAFLVWLAATIARVRASAQSTPPGTEIVDRSERITRATVTILVGREVRERGVVLADDGRVLAALAPLRGAHTVTLRYPNGHTAHADVVANDASWGVALLQPSGGRWPSGLPFAPTARGNLPVRWTEGNEPHSQAAHLRRRHTYVGPGSQLLRDAWEFDPAPGDAAVGSGVANADAQIVALVVPPADGVTSGGAPAPFGVPASVLQDLVTRTGTTAHPWLGLIARNPRQDDSQAYSLDGLRITDITSGGPADRAGLRAGTNGDVIVGTTERQIHSLDDLGAALEGKHPGDTITLRVVRAGVLFDLPVQLGAPPTL